MGSRIMYLRPAGSKMGNILIRQIDWRSQKNRAVGRYMGTACIWDHSFMTSANFPDFWPSLLSTTVCIPAKKNLEKKALQMSASLRPLPPSSRQTSAMGTPLLPRKCWRLKWMVPFIDFWTGTRQFQELSSRIMLNYDGIKGKNIYKKILENISNLFGM